MVPWYANSGIKNLIRFTCNETTSHGIPVYSVYATIALAA
jgi:hypothetical protein